MILPKKIIRKILISIACIATATFSTLGMSVLMISIVRPQLLSGDYVIHQAWTLFQLFTLVGIFSLFIGVFILKDKRFFQ